MKKCRDISYLKIQGKLRINVFFFFCKLPLPTEFSFSTRHVHRSCISYQDYITLLKLALNIIFSSSFLGCRQKLGILLKLRTNFFFLSCFFSFLMFQTLPCDITFYQHPTFVCYLSNSISLHSPEN